MILLLFILNTISPENQIMVKMSTPSMIKFDIEFSNFNQIEQLPITRFIISENPPTYEYKIITPDSFVQNHTFENTNLSPVHIGHPFSIKNCKVYPIVIYPSYLNKSIKVFYKSIEITLKFLSSTRNLDLAPSQDQIFKQLILNYQGDNDPRPLGYLIITPNSFQDEVLPLSVWKEKKGWHVTVATLSQTGNTPADIKNYITNAYHTSSPPPEYVLLIGDVDSIPPYSTANPVRHTDYPYTLIDGNDFFAELLIGRLPANTAGELNTMVAKIIGYEQDPYMTDPSWFTRALVVAANEPGGMTTPIPVKRWVREKFIEYGFGTVDTVFHPQPPIEITNSVNQGVLFANYRGGIASPEGWDFPQFIISDIQGLSNGWKLPIITSITCNTGHFGYPTCFGEAWLRAGNPVTPKGAVAFFGASAATTSSRWNNCLDYGIYWAFLKENIYNLAPALYRGKMEVFMNFPLDTSWSQGSSFYFHTYNLLGDPSLDFWTAAPDTFIVTHLSSIPVGSNSFTVLVENSSSQPVENALVSLYKDGEVKEVEYTDFSGQAEFNFSTSSQDTLFVTVTKHNFKPYCGNCFVGNTPVYVGYDSHTIDDPTGNNNGEVNPGETIEMAITLRNFGTSNTANNVSAKLATTDGLVTITDSTKSYGNIAPGDTATSLPFVFDLSTSAKNSHIIKFNLAITSSQGNWNSSIWINVKAPEFVYQRYQILDGGNGMLEPGETSDLTTSIKNTGGLIGNSISGIFRSYNPGVNVLDSTGSFGDIPIGDSSTNTSNRFRVEADSTISPGHSVRCGLMLSGNNNFRDSVYFKIIIGVVDQTKPLGSDAYGYFAYDDLDVGYAERPTYNWVEIDPELGGPGDTLSLQNDETKTINLPFNFKFYGDWYGKISICSNGYIAMDSTWIADMYNWHIPAAGGPPLLIAPFWDDFDPVATDSSGSVCYWHDATNHRFIIEYSRVQHIHDPTNPTPAELQTFEIILFDPSHYPTKTGDGEILFQYKDILNDDVWHNYATAGIEDREHTTGLEYTYADIYPDAAAVLTNNRAIKFTTNPPDSFPGVEENNQFSVLSKRLVVYPNPFKELTKILYSTGQNTEATSGNTELKIYDVSGRMIKHFEHLQPSGGNQLVNQIIWDGTDNSGCRAPKGVYFIRLVGVDVNIIKKIIFIR